MRDLQAKMESRTARSHLTLVYSRPGSAPIARPRRTAKVGRSANAEAAADSAIYAQALGDLIIAAGGQVPAQVVFAPACAPLDASLFTADLASHSRQLGLAVLAAEINDVHGRTCLEWCEAPGLDRADREPLALDLFNKRWPEDVAAWRARTARFADMIVVSGPPLDQRIEAALVGRAFDGIVLLAHRGLTPTTAIDAALRRCSDVNANVFGVAFVDGAAPSWRRTSRVATGVRAPRVP